MVIFTLGVIPARGGSKRLPGKNTKIMNGKPLIAWTIQEAKKSALDHVIVSTDDPKIAKVAKKWGADVPFMRPKELATDTAKSVDVMVHAAKWCDETLERPDYIFLLQPTSPTRTKDDINQALAMLKTYPSQGYVVLNMDGDPNGLLYATSWDMLINDHSIWNLFSQIFICFSEVPDIDTEEDWKKAEEMLCRRSS